MLRPRGRRGGPRDARLRTALRHFDEGLATLEGVIAEEKAAGRTQQVARALTALGTFSTWLDRNDLARPTLEEALEYSERHALDLWRIHVLAVSAIARARAGALD